MFKKLDRLACYFCFVLFYCLFVVVFWGEGGIWESPLKHLLARLTLDELS